ncbi:succinylglutamate desuccinylase/aspartoacylase family protein [Paenochrobactrum glaciei]|uniref:Succinylglutamate desuccinylase/Aspartoacylase catalytic domain-containing protein n=1 Tax=Paenochrobactrum glaciei TaxID=486407 RepID=A0ABN1GNX4_9HYPH
MVKQINKLTPKFTTHADGSDATLIMHELIGEQDGPTIGISGSIHGNENAGSQAIVDLFNILKTMPIKGRILLLPVANPRAMALNRRFTPLDELNLNREFPGNANGSYSQQLARAISTNFLEKIDKHIDLHSGTDRPTVDYVYILNDEALSRSFGSTVLYRPVEDKEGTSFDGTTKTVTIDQRGISSVVVELGGGIVDQTPYVKRVVDGVLNMLRFLGTIEGEVVPAPKQIVVNEIAGIRPTQGGWLEPLCPPLGQVIKKGELLGRVVSPYTFEVLEEIKHPYENGIMILSHLSRNLVESGDYGFMVGNMEGATD